MATRHLTLDDMQLRVVALERRLANMESAYMELLAWLAPLSGNQLADPQWRRGTTTRTSATCCRPIATKVARSQETTVRVHQIQNHLLCDGGCNSSASRATQ